MVWRRSCRNPLAIWGMINELNQLPGIEFQSSNNPRLQQPSIPWNYTRLTIVENRNRHQDQELLVGAMLWHCPRPWLLENHWKHKTFLYRFIRLPLWHWPKWTCPSLTSHILYSLALVLSFVWVESILLRDLVEHSNVHPERTHFAIIANHSCVTFNFPLDTNKARRHPLLYSGGERSFR